MNHRYGSYSEKREFGRVAIRVPTAIVESDGQYRSPEFFSGDMSRKGCLLFSTRKMSPGEPIHLEITPAEGDKFRVAGKVVKVRKATTALARRSAHAESLGEAVCLDCFGLLEDPSENGRCAQCGSGRSAVRIAGVFGAGIRFVDLNPAVEDKLTGLIEGRVLGEDDGDPHDQRESGRIEVNRIPMQLQGSHEDEKAWHPAHMENISKGGMYVTTPKEMALQDEVRIVLSPPISAAEIRLTGRVISKTRDASAGAYGLGIQFTDSFPQGTAEIEEFIRQLAIEPNKRPRGLGHIAEGFYRLATSLRLTFRVSLITILVVLMCGALGTMGIISYKNNRFTAKDLSEQVIRQTADRISQRIDHLLDLSSLNSLTRRLLTEGRLLTASSRPSHLDFPGITQYFFHTMQIHPQLSYLSLSLQETGEYCDSMRRPPSWNPFPDRNTMQLKAPLSMRQRIRNPQGDITRRDYCIRADGKRLQFSMKEKDPYDPRTRPFYKAAKQAGKDVWTESYLFVNDPLPATPGVTFASPFYSDTETLIGVLTVDFKLDALSAYLQSLKIGDRGFAFVLEERRGKAPRVIAYPDADAIIRMDGDQHTLVSVDQIRDKRIGAFVDGMVSDAAASSRNGRQFEVDHAGISYLAAYQRLQGNGKPNWIIGVLLPEQDIMERVNRNNEISLLIGLSSVLIALMIGYFISLQISRPIEHLAKETEAISTFQLDPKPVNNSMVAEVDRLALALEQMKTGLRSFQKYVPADLVRRLIHSGDVANLSGEVRNITIYFSDIADFTSIAESMSPGKLVDLLGEYFEALNRQIQDNGGTVDKYIGDAIMAFWGAPEENPDHAAAACRTALENQEKLAALGRIWKKEGKPELHTRIGVFTGEVVIGNIGSQDRLNYTAIGDSVNLASRLEGLNKYYGTRVLTSRNTYHAARSEVLGRPLDWVAVKGKKEPILIYELLATRETADRNLKDMVKLQAAALEKYRAQDWEGAVNRFKRIVALRGEEHYTAMMIERCRQYQKNPPGEHWDGVHRMKVK